MKRSRKILALVMVFMLTCMMVPVASAKAPASNFLRADAPLSADQLNQVEKLMEEISTSNKLSASNVSPSAPQIGIRAIAPDNANIYELICYPLRVNENGELYFYDGDVEYMFCNNVTSPGYYRTYPGVYYIYSIKVFEYGAIYPQRVRVTGTIYQDVSLVRQFGGSNGSLNGIFKEYQYIGDASVFTYTFQKGTNYTTDYQLRMSIY